MLSILDEDELTGERQKNKLEVITILGCFLRQSEKFKLGSNIWNRELRNGGYSWLGWTVVHGKADDVIALIKSKQPYDPLLGM